MNNAAAPVKKAPVSTVRRTAPKKKRRGASLEKRKARSGWLFVLPFVLGLLVIYLPVLWDSVVYSFGKIKVLQGGGFRVTSVGFANYQTALFEDVNFIQTLVTGIQELILDIPAIVIFALFMAVLLNQKMFGRAAFRAIFFVPVILCTGLIDQIDSTNALTDYMSQTGNSIDTGAGTDAVAEVVALADIQWMFNSMKIGTELTEYVVNLMNEIYDIINRSGVQMLIFLAGLQSISPAIYESCDIDGASAWEAFWKITIPMVSPMILVNAIYTVIDALTSSTNTVMSYIAGIYNEAGGHELSAAMSWIYFLIVIAIIAVVAGLLSLFIFYQRRD